MKRLLTIIPHVAVFASCNPTTKNNNDMETSGNLTDNAITANATTPKVTGIGGIFFASDNPNKTKEWYGKNLGLEIDDYGSVFEFRNANRPDEINYLRWSAFANGNEFFKPSKKEFMINYRVQNIKGLIAKLTQNGVTILDSMTVDYGKFVSILDPEGNKIQLWEPVDSVLTKLGGKTTK